MAIRFSDKVELVWIDQDRENKLDFQDVVWSRPWVEEGVKKAWQMRGGADAFKILARRARILDSNSLVDDGVITHSCGFFDSKGILLWWGLVERTPACGEVVVSPRTGVRYEIVSSTFVAGMSYANVSPLYQGAE